MKSVIKDPDLFRLFENSYPNTLDTAIRWKGVVKNTDEELTFLITGDIDAMWLRDSANQLQSYLPLLQPSKDNNSLASLFRGAINLHSRYIQLAPFCNSFQPPASANIPLVINTGATTDSVMPSPDPKFVWECKYELDSLAAFLQVSSEYYSATKDADFFSKYTWVKAVQTVMKTVQDMSNGTYGPDGQVLESYYSFKRQTTSATETLANDGHGNPVAGGTNLIRSAFRPSDDATIYQLFIPANMMFSRYLGSAADIMAHVSGQEELSKQMKEYSQKLHEAVMQHGTIDHPKFGKMFAYEVDGFGSANTMDDANIPSLLSAPHLGFISANDSIYQNTRRFVLSSSNPYFMRGKVIESVGGPHVGPGMAWPMASIVRILTSNDDEEISKTLKEILSTTNGLGLIHESVNTFDPSRWTRQW
jgi:meiotically up-regulated gene 157 (Mug157) protein